MCASKNDTKKTIFFVVFFFPFKGINKKFYICSTPKKDAKPTHKLMVFVMGVYGGIYVVPL